MHRVMNTPAQVRAAATLLLPARSGVPLIKSTPDLEVVRVWMDGTHSCDYDMVSTRDRAAKYLPGFLTNAFDKLVRWKESEGYHLAPYVAGEKAPRGTGYTWRSIGNGRFWVAGPYEALVFKTKRIKDAEDNYVDIARRQTVGEERLQETGGKIAYRVAAYFTVRKHVAEIRIGAYR